MSAVVMNASSEVACRFGGLLATAER